MPERWQDVKRIRRVARELMAIAEVNDTVPANPPKTFHEALQAVWTVESLFEVEENQTGLSLGRMDQYCYPMYAADIESGRLSRDQALELMQAFIIKCSEMMWMSSELGAKYFAGYQPFINLTVRWPEAHRWRRL